MLARTESTGLGTPGLARRPYLVHGTLGALGLLTGTAAVIGFVRAVRVDPSAAHRISIDGHALSYPAVNLAAAVLILVAALGATSLARILREGVRLWRGHRRVTRDLRTRAAGTRSIEVGGVVTRFTVFEDADPEAFCIGFLRPEIFVSTGALARLDARQLAAVVAHEAGHQRAHDPLRALGGRLLARGLFFLPVLARLWRGGELLAELDADDHALRSCRRDPSALASAMLVLGHADEEPMVGIGPQRVDHLLGDFVRPRLPRALLAVGVATIAAMLVVMWRVWRSASISATFALPLISRQPCVVVLALVPAVLLIAHLARADPS